MEHNVNACFCLECYELDEKKKWPNRTRKKRRWPVIDSCHTAQIDMQNAEIFISFQSTSDERNIYDV